MYIRITPPQISGHLKWAGATTARTHDIKHACHATWPMYMLEECGVLPARSLSSRVGITVRRIRSCRLAPAFLKPPGPPRAMLDGVRRQCLGDEGGGLLFVTSSFGVEPPRTMPPFVKVIGRGDRPETAYMLAEHLELKAGDGGGRKIPPLPPVACVFLRG